MPGRGATDVILILRQLQEKCLAKKKGFYFTFADLRKAQIVFLGMFGEL